MLHRGHVTITLFSSSLRDPTRTSNVLIQICASNTILVIGLPWPGVPFISWTCQLVDLIPMVTSGLYSDSASLDGVADVSQATKWVRSEFTVSTNNPCIFFSEVAFAIFMNPGDTEGLGSSSTGRKSPQLTRARRRLAASRFPRSSEARRRAGGWRRSPAVRQEEC